LNRVKDLPWGASAKGGKTMKQFLRDVMVAVAATVLAAVVIRMLNL